MEALFSTFVIKGKQIRNRIVFPPVVCFHYSVDDGMVTERNIAHYHEIASGGSGIVITEATAVSREGRLAPFQLGIWSDDHIPGMSQITRVVRSSGALSLLQIHHAGNITPESVAAVAKGPSRDENNSRSVELTMDEITGIAQAFIDGALRAAKAGFDGVELHGAHGYLLNQFASSLFNRRDDEFGGDTDRNLRLALEIIRGIRHECGENFIIAYRMGANSPTLADGVEIAQKLEAAGVDLLHVSHGGSLQNIPRPPQDFQYNWIVYSGTVVKSNVRIPVIAVNEIKTAERADFLIRSGLVDFVALGRPQLADPEWVNQTQSGKEPVQCFACKPKCRWYENSDLCPARKQKGQISNS